jgi:hypothetical protein
MLALSSTAFAQGSQPPVPQHSEATWQAAYWNNTTLTGTPVKQQSESAINYDWGNGAPAPGINADGFSARWTRYIDEPAGTYRFTAVSDDGIRVWIDNELIVNEWNDHAVRTTNVDRTLSAGHHLITVEYYENGGQAVARLSWAPITVITNWRGEYFNNTALTGPAAAVRDEANVSFNWGGGSPWPGIIGTDNFSARWSRTLSLPAGNYHFSATVDDGVRLWVNGHLLVDAWQVQSVRTFGGDIYLPGGNVAIVMEYFEAGGLAVAQLSWTTGTTPPPPPPTGVVIVDDSSGGFVRGGTASSWRNANVGYNGHIFWTKNNDQQRPNYNYGRWYPTLGAGRYEVFVYIPSNYANTTQARYWVSHRDGFTLRIVNQAIYSDQWVSLGTYTFRGTNADYVSLSDITYEPYITKMIGFDAAKWEPR